MAEPDNSAVVEVDAEATGADSTYEEELSNYSTSLASSILNHREENGRRYHAYSAGSYLLPNDEPELERLDIGHHLTRMIMDQKLYHAPVQNPSRAIDIGTGTGIWAIEFADEFPLAEEVLGIDLSPIQPTWVPANVKFVIDDIEKEWAYGNNPFDFIHARYLASSIKSFPRLLHQCYENVKPGGWVEFQDWDMQIRSDDNTAEESGLGKYYDILIPALEKKGYSCRPGPNLEHWFSEAGFVNIKVQRYSVPLGAWPKDKHLKEIGTWFLMSTEQKGFEAAALAVLTRFEGWRPDEVTVLAAKARAAAKDRAVHGLFDL
ncbi:hypothetical protein DTO027B5_8485 [Paecilomyces variotii]|nr:hypothetical protein DTO021C3_8821 [Paecilomyces variotii]KAJ9328971.1 hypothetical protein DTO027B5_8485 [Paecilomyces variotii]